MPSAYPCTWCRRSFTGRGQLTRHLQIHVNKNQKRYSCLQCSYCAHQWSNLERHILVKHSECKPHICSSCQRLFKDKYVLNRHVKQCRESTAAQPARSLASVPADFLPSIQADCLEAPTSPQMGYSPEQGGTTVVVSQDLSRLLALPADHSHDTALTAWQSASPVLLSQSYDHRTAIPRCATCREFGREPDLQRDTLAPLPIPPLVTERRPNFDFPSGQHVPSDTPWVQIDHNLTSIGSAPHPIAMAQRPAAVNQYAEPSGMAGGYFGGYSHWGINHDTGGAFEPQMITLSTESVVLPQQPTYVNPASHLSAFTFGNVFPIHNVAQVFETTESSNMYGSPSEIARPEGFFAHPPSMAEIARFSPDHAGSVRYPRIV